jgi:hypothetical protein
MLVGERQQRVTPWVADRQRHRHGLLRALPLGHGETNAVAQIKRQALVASPRVQPGGSAGLPAVATDAGGNQPTGAGLQRSTGCGTEAEVDKAATSDQRAMDRTAARC